MSEHQGLACERLFGEAVLERHRAIEQAYRRGVSQALSMAAEVAEAGGDWKDLSWLTDESLSMRHSPEAFPAYLDELRGRLGRRRATGGRN